MREFRSESRGGFRGRDSGRFSGGGGGRGGGRGGFGGERRRPLEMHEVTCDKCGKQCEVPFKPTGDKPVYCSECFEKNDSGRSSSSRFSPRGSGSAAPAGMSPEQFKQISVKLDKILQVLQDLEIVADEESEDEDEEESVLEESEEDEKDSAKAKEDDSESDK